MNQYGIRLAWNNDPALYQVTRVVSAEEDYTVAFTEEMKQYADDPEILEAIRLAILEERETEKNSDSHWITDFIMKQPVLVGVDGPYEGTYDELAVRFYEENNLIYYNNVMKKASGETQKALITRAYQEKNYPYFSLSEELLTPVESRQFLELAYGDEEIAIYSIVAGQCDVNTLYDLACRAYDDDRIDFFSVTAPYLDEAQCAELAGRARKDGREPYLYVIPGTKQYN